MKVVFNIFYNNRIKKIIRNKEDKLMEKLFVDKIY